VKSIPFGNSPACPFVFGVVVCALGVFCALDVPLPATASAQTDSSAVRIMGEGETDTLRLDDRAEGREERILDSRVSEQKIGYEERKIRLERRAEELLREEEVTRARQEKFGREEEQARAEARRREAEDIQRKKRTVQGLPDL
jgi:hypothetical protein